MVLSQFVTACVWGFLFTFPTLYVVGLYMSFGSFVRPDSFLLLSHTVLLSCNESDHASCFFPAIKGIINVTGIGALTAVGHFTEKG